MPVKPPPSDIFGALFEAVQDARLYPDSKSFADAIPRSSPEEIYADWRNENPADTATLRLFVEKNFILPDDNIVTADPSGSLIEYLANAWEPLTRTLATVPDNSSALSLPYPFIVPGGRFRELYYWDSYFTMLGLVISGRQDLVEDMIANFGSLIDRFGHIPNGTRSYYLSRSHPPVFYLAVKLSRKYDRETREQYIRWMRAEHAFWMDGEAQIASGEAHRRVVRLANGSLLNRYWDDRPHPRDESWAEDKILAAEAPDRNSEELWRDLRAAAESGWDFSTRWFAKGNDFSSIRTTGIIPIDLNCLLFGLETTIAAEMDALGDPDASLYFQRASLRRQAINHHLWNEDKGFYADFNLDTASVSNKLTAAAAFPLFVGLATKDQARRNAQNMKALIYPFGLVTTLINSGQQWDCPNGWAPLQWVAFSGLQQYGEEALAREIATGWIEVVSSVFRESGQMLEKYDVVKGVAGGGGEYAVEIGFGWTNGVTLALMNALDTPNRSLEEKNHQTA